MNTITKDTLKKCESINNSSEECILEKSKDNKNIFKIRKDNKLIYLGSKYNVNREIEKCMVNKEKINIKTTIVVFGLGTGEHILELVEYTDENKIIIVEPNLNVIKEFLKLEYSKDVVNEDRIIIYHYEKESVENFLSSSVGHLQIRNLQYLIFANYNSIYDQEYRFFSEKLKLFIIHITVGFNTMNFFSNEFIKNYMNNLPYILEGKRINDFKDKFKNYPAVIVSAGPSLEKNIDLLKEIQNKIIIICGGRTLGPLIKKGIKPDFVCVVDPGEGSYKVIENDLNNQVPMVFCEYTNEDVINEYKGNKIYLPQPSVEKITQELIEIDTDTLLLGGSVAHTCTSFGVYLGCDPIIFIGQDCAYTNDKHHADIADTLEEQQIGDYDLYVDDIYGNKVATSYVLNSFRKDMERNIKIFKDNIFVNSTEGGANIEGTIVMPLKKSIEKYCTNIIDKNLEDIFLKPCKIDRESVKNKLRDIIKNLKNVEKQSKIGVQQSQKLLSFYTLGKKVELNSILKSLDDVDEHIRKARQINILEALLSPVIFEVLTSKEFIKKFNETDKGEGIRVAKRSKSLYQGILNAVQQGKPLIEKCIANIK